VKRPRDWGKPEVTTGTHKLLRAAAFRIFLVTALLNLPAVAEEPNQIRVGVSAYLSYAPFHIADQEGFFADHGLEVELVNLRRSYLWLAPLIRGDLDVGAGQLSPGLFNAMARGARIQFVAGKEVYASSSECTYLGILVSTELAQRGSPGDATLLRGKVVSLERNSVYGYFLDRTLQPAGLELSDAFTRVVAPAVEVEAVRRGQIDAFNSAEPWVTRALDTGVVVLAHSAQVVMPDFPGGIVVFGQTLLEGRPDLGQRFMAAYLAGVRRYEEGKTERNLEILSRSLELEQRFLERACWPTFSRGPIDHGQLLEFQKWLKAQGLLNETLATEDYWEPRFIRQTPSMAGEVEP